MKRIGKLIVAGALALSGVVAPFTASQPAYAEDSQSSSATWIQVTPVSARVVLQPGTEADYSMVVSNVGSEAFDFSAYAAPYTIVDENYNVSFSDETNRSQIVDWIKFINDDGSLSDTYRGSVEAGGKKSVNYRVVVPQDIPAGGQYATIFAQTEANNESGSESTTGLKTVSRIGMVVYGRAGGETKESAEIAEYNIPGFLFSGPVKVNSLVKNTGNTDFEARYELVVKSIFGSEIYSVADANNILPDTARREELTWENSQTMGIFNVTYRVEAMGEVREETRLVIILPVFMIIIIIAVLTILTIWIIMVIRKRKERKSRLVV